MNGKLIGRLVLVLAMTIALGLHAFSQADVSEEQRIINTIPSKVPVKIEFINGGMRSALYKIEIRVTNVGKKTIYFMSLGVASEKEFTPRNSVGFSSFHIGNASVSDFSRPFASLKTERDATVPFVPGETRSFWIKRKEAELSWKLMKDYGYPADAKLILYSDLVRFEDGTGFMSADAVDMPDPKP